MASFSGWNEPLGCDIQIECDVTTEGGEITVPGYDDNDTNPGQGSNDTNPDNGTDPDNGTNPGQGGNGASREKYAVALVFGWMAMILNN